MTGSRRAHLLACDDERVDDLIAFLNARLDEDEAAAKDVRYIWPTGFEVTLNPARILREVEAKRVILGACVETLQGEDSHDYLTDGGSGEEYELARFVIRQLAAVWSDHPDYRQEWKS